MSINELWTLLATHGAGAMEFRAEESENYCYCLEALLYLDEQTFGRICPVLGDEELERCAEAWLELETLMRQYRGQEAKGRLASETLGGWSRSWEKPEKTKEQQMSACLRRCLSGTSLLYRGMD